MCGFYFSENRLSELTYEQQQQQHEVYTQNAAEHGSGIDSNIVLHTHTFIYYTTERIADNESRFSLVLFFDLKEFIVVDIAVAVVMCHRVQNNLRV